MRSSDQEIARKERKGIHAHKGIYTIKCLTLVLELYDVLAHQASNPAGEEDSRCVNGGTLLFYCVKTSIGHVIRIASLTAYDGRWPKRGVLIAHT